MGRILWLDNDVEVIGVLTHRLEGPAITYVRERIEYRGSALASALGKSSALAPLLRTRRRKVRYTVTTGEHVVEKVRTGAEAWAAFSQEPYGAMILGLIMGEDSRYTRPPGLDLFDPRSYLGLDVLRNLRSSEHNAQTPVVILTHVTDQAVLDEARALGVSEVLEKVDTRPSELTDAVERAMAAPAQAAYR